MRDAAGFLEPGLGEPTPAYLSVYGTLLLTGAMAAARAEDRATTQEFLRKAESAASRLGADANYMWTAFGATNLAIHRVATAGELEIGRLLAVDWAPSPTEGDKVLYLFDGGVLPAELRGRIQLQAAEIGAYDFHPLDAVADLTIPRLARRIEAAAVARAEGWVAYLEHGRAPGRGGPVSPRRL